MKNIVINSDFAEKIVNTFTQGSSVYDLLVSLTKDSSVEDKEAVFKAIKQFLLSVSIVRENSFSLLKLESDLSASNKDFEELKKCSDRNLSNKEYVHEAIKRMMLASQKVCKMDL